jgi:hypothetical protein
MCPQKIFPVVLLVFKGYKGTTRKSLKVGLDTAFEVALICSKIRSDRLKIIVELLNYNVC